MLRRAPGFFSLILKTFNKAKPCPQPLTFSFLTPYATSALSCPKMSSAFANPPGILFSWDLKDHSSPQALLEGAARLASELEAKVQAVAAVPEPPTPHNLLTPILANYDWFFNPYRYFTLPSEFAVDKELRDAAREAKKSLQETLIRLNMNVTIFQRLDTLLKELEAGALKLDGEEARALRKLVAAGKRNGLHLSPEKREEVQKLNLRLSELCLLFGKNISEDNTSLLFTEQELAGVSASFLSGLEKGEAGRFKVTMKAPHVVSVMESCSVEATRKKVHETRNAIAMEENSLILEEMVQLRDKLAKILGFKNHSEFVLDELMAKSPEKVMEFLVDLKAKLTPLWEKEKKAMLELKQEEGPSNGVKNGGTTDTEPTLNLWDTAYYTEKLAEKVHALDKEKYRPYFPLDHVTAKMFEIYELLLHVKFTQVENPPVWFEGVTLYSVRDTRDDLLLGSFYLDLFPRDGKYTHFCCENCQYTCENEKGERVPTVVVMLCNFTPPQDNKPSLLQHEEVETYFHEFGHVMHAICGKAKTSFFTGATYDSCSGTERDFIECPSQMLENWVWHKVPLKLMSRHYENGDPLPDEMIEKLIASRNLNSGLFNLRQIVYGLFDQRIHTTDSCSTAQVYAKTMKEVLGFEVLPNTNFAATFNHMREYDAKYYSYLWSEVFSADMFKTVFDDDLLSPEKGLRYRECILQPSGTVDAYDMLRNFLGRDPKPDAFLKIKGL